MTRLYLVHDFTEVGRRRRLLPPNTMVEAWPDVQSSGLVWIAPETKTTLDGLGAPLTVELAVDATAVSVYYGPWLTDVEALPTEDSLRTRIVSGHGIAAAWVTLDRFGERTGYQPSGMTDRTFALRRPRTAVSHLWRLFATRDEARIYLREFYGNDPEAEEWAAALAVGTYADLIERYGRRGDPGAG